MFLAWIARMSKRFFSPRVRGRTIRRKPWSRRPELEALEDRCVPAGGGFSAQYGNPTTHPGGNVLTGDVPVYLIFSGGQNAKYGYDGNVTRQQIINAVNNILNSNYLSGLGQYGAATRAHVAQTYVTNEVPSQQLFTIGGEDTDIGQIVTDSIDDNGGQLPEPDDTDTTGVYVVFTPQGYALSDRNAAAEHSSGDTGGFLDGDNAYEIAVPSGQFDKDNNYVGQAIPTPGPQGPQPSSQLNWLQLSALDTISVDFSPASRPRRSRTRTRATVSRSRRPRRIGTLIRKSSLHRPPRKFATPRPASTAPTRTGRPCSRTGPTADNAYIIPGGNNRLAVDRSMLDTASLSAFAGTLTSVQITYDHTGVFGLDNQHNLWRSLGYEWTQIDSNVQSFMLLRRQPRRGAHPHHADAADAVRRPGGDDHDAHLHLGLRHRRGVVQRVRQRRRDARGRRQRDRG